MTSVERAALFEDKTVIVTGGGTGVGLAIVEAFVAEGAKVVITGRRREPLQAVVDRFPDSVVMLLADVANAEDCFNVVKFTLDRYGRLDILVNNAGICLWKYFSDCSTEEFDKVMAINATGTAYMSKAAWPHLIKAGKGRIINTSSSSIFGLVTEVAYSMAKTGVIGFTRSLGHEGEEHGINVNAILPLGASEMSDTLPEPSRTVFRERLPAASIAPFVLWLCLPGNKVNSEAFTVAGGRVAKVLLGVNPGVIPKENTIQEWDSLIDEVLSDKLALVPKTCYEETMFELEGLGISIDIRSPEEHRK